MGHTKPALLADIQKELEIIRSIGGIKEKTPGIFYLKSVPFLHFHDSGGRRWADVKTPDGVWKSIDIDFKATRTQKASFVETARVAHEKLTLSKGKNK